MSKKKKKPNAEITSVESTTGTCNATFGSFGGWKEYAPDTGKSNSTRNIDETSNTQQKNQPKQNKTPNKPNKKSKQKTDEQKNTKDVYYNVFYVDVTKRGPEHQDFTDLKEIKIKGTDSNMNLIGTYNRISARYSVILSKAFCEFSRGCLEIMRNMALNAISGDIDLDINSFKGICHNIAIALYRAQEERDLFSKTVDLLYTATYDPQENLSIRKYDLPEAYFWYDQKLLSHYGKFFVEELEKNILNYFVEMRFNALGLFKNPDISFTKDSSKNAFGVDEWVSLYELFQSKTKSAFLVANKLYHAIVALEFEQGHLDALIDRVRESAEAYFSLCGITRFLRVYREGLEKGEDVEAEDWRPELKEEEICDSERDWEGNFKWRYFENSRYNPVARYLKRTDILTSREFVEPLEPEIRKVFDPCQGGPYKVRLRFLGNYTGLNFYCEEDKSYHTIKYIITNIIRNITKQAYPGLPERSIVDIFNATGSGHMRFKGGVSASDIMKTMHLRVIDLRDSLEDI